MPLQAPGGQPDPNTSLGAVPPPKRTPPVEPCVTTFWPMPTVVITPSMTSLSPNCAPDPHAAGGP